MRDQPDAKRHEVAKGPLAQLARRRDLPGALRHRARAPGQVGRPQIGLAPVGIALDRLDIGGIGVLEIAELLVAVAEPAEDGRRRPAASQDQTKDLDGGLVLPRALLGQAAFEKSGDVAVAHGRALPGRRGGLCSRAHTPIGATP